MAKEYTSAQSFPTSHIMMIMQLEGCERDILLICLLPSTGENKHLMIQDSKIDIWVKGGILHLNR